MELKIIKKNLFDIDEKYYLAHCISADAAMGAGIAVDFKKKFSYVASLSPGQKVCKAVLTGRVFNLITKKVYYGKPTETTFIMAIQDMKRQIIENDIKFLATYKLGCTRDRLSWGFVKQVLEDEFKDIDIEIVICTL